MNKKHLVNAIYEPAHLTVKFTLRSGQVSFEARQKA